MTSVDPRLMANAIRFLSMDAIERAGEGHPGTPLGAALVAILAGGFDKGPLLLGLAGTYVILLGAETAYLLRWWQRRAASGPPAR